MKKGSCSISSKLKGLVAVFLVFAVIFGFSSASASADDIVLQQVKYIVKNYYVDKISDDSLNKATSVSAVIGLLNDPYSQYFSNTEFQQFENAINNTFVGIGIVVEEVPEGIKAASVLDASPAKDAGIRSGDIITEAGGVKLAGLSSSDATSYIKGKEGTTVHLKILRDGSYIEMDVPRKEVSSPTVNSQVVDGHIGYIEVTSFGSKTASEFSNALTSLRNAKVDSYIVDLRNNPGGYLDTALNMAGYFIGMNTALITVDRLNGTVKHSAYKHDYIIDKPVIFLTNGNSASASEILSAAVKDYGKALFIGQTTYGKGKAQNMFSLADGGVFKMTTERFYSPKGKTIDKVGISPDIALPNNVDALGTALFLSEKAPVKNDKTGYGLVKLANRQFVINMGKVRDSKYWNISYNILTKLPEGSFYIGTKKGWVKVNNVKSTVLKYFPTGKKYGISVPSAYLYSSLKYTLTSKYIKRTK